MGKDQIMYCIVALLLGMLMYHMLKGVCGCKNVVEGAKRTEQADAPAVIPVPKTQKTGMLTYFNSYPTCCRAKDIPKIHGQKNVKNTIRSQYCKYAYKKECADRNGCKWAGRVAGCPSSYIPIEYLKKKNVVSFLSKKQSEQTNTDFKNFDSYSKKELIDMATECKINFEGVELLELYEEIKICKTKESRMQYWRDNYALKNIEITIKNKYNKKTINFNAIIFDTCDDSDCGECCSEHMGNEDALIDIEYHSLVKLSNENPDFVDEEVPLIDYYIKKCDPGCCNCAECLKYPDDNSCNTKCECGQGTTMPIAGRSQFTVTWEITNYPSNQCPKN